MADPVSALLIVGASISAAGSVYSGVAGNQAARLQAQQQARDAAVARELGAAEAELALADGRRLEGAALAEAGASGFDAGGTVYDGLASIAQASSLDAAAFRYEADRRAEGLISAARQSRIAGTRSLVTGVSNAGGTLLSGVASASLSKGAI